MFNQKKIIHNYFKRQLIENYLLIFAPTFAYDTTA